MQKLNISNQMVGALASGFIIGVATLLFGVMPVPAHAQWSELAVISPTAPLSTSTVGGLCYTDGEYIACDGTVAAFDLENGRLGIGTNSPSSTLHVLSSNNINGGLRFSSAVGTEKQRLVLYPEGNSSFRIQKLNANAVLNFINSSGVSEFVIGSTGNVGIGTTALNAKLAVAGTISATGLTVSGTANVDALVVNGTAITSGGASSIDGLADAAKNDTDYNIFLGHTGGSVGAEDDDNIALGHTALDSLNNSGGDFNIALGRGALTTNTEGDGNIAIGYEALNLATTGANTAVGYRAGYLISGTVANVSAMGYQAANANTGTNVSAMGYFAAYQNTGANVSAMGVHAARANTGANVSAMGAYAAYQNTGVNVSAVGYEAANANTGAYVSAIGYQAARQNTGASVSAMGYEAASGNTGANVSAMGLHAAYQNTGANVSAMGGVAARENTGANVSAMGYEAARMNTGANVSAMGAYAAWQNTGANVSVMGVNAARWNTGANVSAMGGGAAYQNSGSNASVFGYETIRYRNASNTTAIGYQAGRGGDTTRQNILNGTFLGYRAGYGVGEGANNNLYLGYDVGQGTHTGSNNILIGYDIDPSSGTASNELNIGNLVYGNTSVDRVGINVPSPTTTLEVAGTVSATAFQGDGSLLTNLPIPEATIPTALVNGTSSITVVANQNIKFGMAGTRRAEFNYVTGSLQFYGGGLDIGGGDHGYILMRQTHPKFWWLYGDMRFMNGGGNGEERLRITSTGNVGIGTTAPNAKLEVAGTISATAVQVAENVTAAGYLHSSDARLKTNIQPLPNGLETVLALRGVQYNLRADNSPKAGVIAQEIAQVLPNAVVAGENGMLSVDYNQIIAPLIEAVKSLKAENDALRARVDALERTAQ